MFPKILKKVSKCIFQIRIGCSYELNKINSIQENRFSTHLLVTKYFQPVYFEHNQKSGTLYLLDVRIKVHIF